MTTDPFSCTSYVAGVIFPNRYEFELYLEQYLKHGGKPDIYSTEVKIGNREVSVLRCFDPEYAKNDKYKKVTNNPCFVGMVSGLGLVNAAMSTQLLFTEYSADNFIIGGIAGTTTNYHIALEEDRDTFDCPCDVVVPSSWAITDLQVSMPTTATPSDPVPLEGIDYTRDPPAEYMYQCPAEQTHLTWVEPSHLIQGNGKVTKQMFWDADPRLMEIAKEVASNVTSIGLGGFTQLETQLINCTSQCRNYSTVRVGNTNGGSSNTFQANAERGEWLLKTYNISTVDMETAAAAQVATTYEVPFIGLRGISDTVGSQEGQLILECTEPGRNCTNHADGAEVAMRNVAALVDGMLIRLCDEAAEFNAAQNAATTNVIHVLNIIIMLLGTLGIIS